MNSMRKILLRVPGLEIGSSRVSIVASDYSGNRETLWEGTIEELWEAVRFPNLVPVHEQVEELEATERG